MEQKIFQDYPEESREAAMEPNAIRGEEKIIQKYFTEDEMTEKRLQLANNNLLIKREDEILDRAKEIFREKTKPAFNENEYLLTNLQHGFQDVVIQVYLFPDYENKMIGYYDNMGNLIESRRMKPGENQVKIPTK